MKEKWHKFLDEYVSRAVMIIGLPAALYCLWLQSGGISVASGTPVVSFGFIYINFFLAFAVVVLAVMAGYAINEYFKAEAKKSSEVRKLIPEDFIHTARWYPLLFLLSFLAGFMMAELIWVLVGVFGMVFSATGIFFFRKWVSDWRKAQKAQAVSEPAEGADQ